MKYFLALALVLISGVSHSASRRYSAVSGGLPATLAEALPLRPDRNYIFFILKSPSSVFDLRSAEQLRRSLLSSTGSKIDLGHAMLAWSCTNSKTLKISEGATAQTGEVKDQSLEMIKSGWGMTTFLSTFTDGRLSRIEDVDKDIQKASREGTLRLVGVEVSESQCFSLVSFIKRYADGPEDAQTNFGFTQNPLKYEGAGCGSFAVAGLMKAKLFPQITPYLWRHLTVPQQFLGRGGELPGFVSIEDPRYLGSRSIGPGELETTPWVGIASDPAEAPELRIADPEMMVHLIESLESQVARRQGKPRTEIARTLRSLSDYSDTRIPLFSTQKIDANFDPQTRRLENEASKWVDRFLRAGGKVSPIEVLGHKALLFEKP